MKSDSTVIEYYDQFKVEQIKTGLNARHRNILFTIVKSGLRRYHKVLEIGCGIGIISGALSSYVRKGEVTGVDISPESIFYAQRKFSRKQNLDFIVSDIQQLELDRKFDYIILPDVLEHIPLELHNEVFEKLIRMLNPDGRMYIHIPSGTYNQYIIDHEPENLQVIDHALDAHSVITKAELNGFELIRYSLLSLHVEEGDYAMMLFRIKNRLHSVSRFKGIKRLKAELYSRIRFILFKIQI